MPQKTPLHKHILHLFLLSTFVFLLCGLCSCTPSILVDSPKAKSSQDAFETFLNDQFRSSFENDLINLHYTLKNPADFGIEKPEKASSDITLDYPEQTKQNLTETKKALHQINQNHLTEGQQRIYITLDKYLNQQIELCNYPQFLNPLSYATGLSSSLPLTLAEYTFYSEEDVKDYLSILPQIPELLKQAYIWEENQTKNGYGMTDFEMEHTIEQIDTFLDISESNLLIDSFTSRINSVPGISEDQKTTYLKNNESLIKTAIFPAFTNLKESLTSLQKTALKGQGLCHYKDGKAYYEALLASMTLSDQSISAMIHSLENNLENITDCISDIVIKNPEIYNIFLLTMESDVLPDQSPKEMLLHLEKAIKQDYPELSSITYKAEPIPDALENDTTAAYYLIPPFDSPEENRIYYGKAMTDNASLYMTLSHEGYPGHLYHQNYLLQNNLHPIFYLLDITGYKEGWAFYAEIDAADYYDFGIYEKEYHDELVELYRCNLEYSYCISSLIDLYVNGKGYTEEKIIEFASSIGMDQETAISLYEYAIEEPGTYLQYYIGYLEILEIRQSAEFRKGKNFDEKAFHTTLLDLGPCFYKDLAKYMREKY